LRVSIQSRLEDSDLSPAAEVDPRLVFERLFPRRSGETAEARARRQYANKSILDYALTDAQRLRSNLGSSDKQKLDDT